VYQITRSGVSKYHSIGNLLDSNFRRVLDRCVVLNTEYTRVGIEVLVQSKLEDRRSTITRDNNGPGQEEDPETIPPIIALALD